MKILSKNKKLNEIESKINNKMGLNQQLYSIKNLCKDKNIYKKRRDPIIDRDDNGNILHMSIDCFRKLKKEFVLYKKYSKDSKEHSIIDIVIKTKKINNMNKESRIKYLTKIYNNAKKYNRKVFIYELEDKEEWNNLWFDIVNIFNNYPISRYI